jgi:hypothetical protein
MDIQNESPYVMRWEGFGPLGADAQKVGFFHVCEWKADIRGRGEQEMTLERCTSEA